MGMERTFVCDMHGLVRYMTTCVHIPFFGFHGITKVYIGVQNCDFVCLWNKTCVGKTEKGRCLSCQKTPQK